MGKWQRQDEMVCVKGTVVCYAAQDEDEAGRIVRKHNADCDAYEKRIAELESRLARIAALVKPVPVADLVEAGTDAPQLLAERHRQIRAILEEAK